MASKIEWLHVPGYRAETWNPWIGCTPVSRGCERCFAKREEDGRFRDLGHCLRPDTVIVRGANDCPETPGGTRDVILGDKYFWRGPVYRGETELMCPLHWREPRAIGVCRRSDLFHKDIPFTEINRVFAVMVLCPQHLFLVLTKRPERAAEYMATAKPIPAGGQDRAYGILEIAGRLKAKLTGRQFAKYAVGFHWPLPNVWLGTSVEDQPTAGERIPELLKCPAALHFVSIEPMIGSVDVRRYIGGDDGDYDERTGLSHCVRCGTTWDADEHECPPGFGPRLDWLICGGESGTGARPMHPDWARLLLDDCQAAGVPFFFKQHGEWAGVSLRAELTGEKATVLLQVAPGRWQPELPMRRVGKKRAGRLLDGVEHNEFPA